MTDRRIVSEGYGLFAVILLSLAAVLVTAVCAQEEVDDMDSDADHVKELPEPQEEGDMSVEAAIAGRRSVRSFDSRELSEQQIGQLLWAAQGITDDRRQLRAAPSAGATYPLEIHLATAEWVGHYLPEEHALEIIATEDLRTALMRAALGQRFIADAPAVIVVSAVPERTTQRYGERGIRYIHMEAGHVAQNVHLQAVSLGLGSVPVGAARDEQIKDLLELSDDSLLLYIIPTGYKQ